MIRKLTALTIGLAFAALAGPGGAEPPAVKSGDALKGELTAANKVVTAYAYTAQTADGRGRGFNTAYVVSYSLEYSVALKAGQDLTVAAKVVGKDRGVLLVLIDPTGRAIDGTEVRPGTVEVTFDEVSATGRYRLIVASDRIGDFTLQIKPFSDRDLEIRALELRIAWLKRDINETEAKLKALKAKKGP